MADFDLDFGIDWSKVEAIWNPDQQQPSKQKPVVQAKDKHFPLSQEDYTTDPTCCPFCGSTRFGVEHEEYNKRSIDMIMECEACGNSWQNTYLLVKYSPRIEDNE